MSLLIRRVALFSMILSTCLLSIHSAAQNTIFVPGDQATIQGAITVANTGDTVMVAPGTYSENINFNGKAITVTSSGGASVTTIDGSGKAPVVIFNTGEGPNSALNGFTIQNGTAAGTSANPNFEGGGIYIRSTSPTITNNVIQNNTACSDGGGIAVNSGSPRIQGNVIQNNTQAACSGGTGGGGIEVGGSGAAQILGNTIANNTWPSGNGGGISLNAASPTISNNILYGNVATGVSPAARGGGISTVNNSDPLIVQNVIYNNSAGQGSGISLSVPSGDRGPIVVNNTLSGGLGANQGSALYITGFDNQVQFFNNLFIGASGPNAVYCDGTFSQQPPIFTNNDAFLSGGTGFAGTCAGTNGQNGNLSVDPQFVNPATGNFNLQPSSPAIDAGSNSALNLPQFDLAKNPRILDGNNDCVSTVDLGVYEMVRNANVNFSASSLSFLNQPLGLSSSPQAVTLSNTGSGCYSFSSQTITGDFSQSNNCSTTILPGGTSCTYNVTFTPLATGTRVGALTVSGSDGLATMSPVVSLSGVGTDFSVTATPSSVSVKHGQSMKINVSVDPVGGTVSSTVALTCTGTPSAATCSLLPSSVTPGNTGATSVLTLTTIGKTPRGTFKLLITGSGGNAIHTTTVMLTVN